MSRPRLLAVSGLPPWPVRGGFALRAAGLLEALARTWDIDLVVGADVDRDAGGEAMREIFAVPEAEPWRPVPNLRRDHRALREAVDGVIARRRPDAALLLNGTEFLAFGRDARRRAGGGRSGPGAGRTAFPRAVADRIDCGTLERTRYIRYARYLRRLGAIREAWSEGRYERRVVRSLPATTVVGEDDAAALRRIAGTDGVHVVVNGVRTRDGPGFDEESPRPTVLFTGTLSYYANADAVRYFVRRIWPRIRAGVEGARFVAAGRTPGRSLLRLAAEPGVEIRADVPDMSAVISESWVTVAPMRCGAGVKNKVLEAWATGRPAVVTPLGGNGLCLDEQAAGLVAGDPGRFAALVLGLLRDRARRHEMGGASQRLARARHTWEGSAAALSELLGYQARSGS